MPRSFPLHAQGIVILIVLLAFSSIDALRTGSYTSGLADIVRLVFRHELHRFFYHQTGYDSDVFRYTQMSINGNTGLYAGESCRLTPTMCSHDEQCCSGRCLCRRWLIIGEQRCIRKCF